MKNEQQKTKFKFGRNPLSLIIILAAIGLVFLIFYPIYSYSSTWNNNNVTPFLTYYKDSANDSEKVQEKKKERLSTSLPSNITDLKTTDKSIEVIKMKGKDFDLFDVNITCKSYTNIHSGSDSAEFSFNLKWNDKTSEDLGGVKALVPFNNDSKNDIKLTSCFAADWVGFCKYQTSTSISSKIITPEADETDYDGANFTSTISGLDYFPAKAKTWPVNVSVKTPDLFLYIEFKYQNNGNKTRIYVLQYTFDEYNPDAAAGGIYTK